MQKSLEQGDLYGRACREDEKGRNDVIILSRQKVKKTIKNIPFKSHRQML